jgi:predicted O-methyltransferase YrrM
MDEACRLEVERLWNRKVDQDARGLPKAERHRNLEPDSAELLHALAVGVEARRLLEIGGSSGVSTIALASAAMRTAGRVVSIELEPVRQAEAKATIARLGLASVVDFRLADAAQVLPTLDEHDLVLLDCEKEDYARFFDMLRLAPGAIVVADNIISHELWDYVAHVRRRAGVESMTLPVGKGLEVTRFVPVTKTAT